MKNISAQEIAGEFYDPAGELLLLKTSPQCQVQINPLCKPGVFHPDQGDSGIQGSRL